MKKSHTITIIFCLTLLLSLPIYAEKVSGSKEKKQINICAYDWAPYITYKDGEFAGTHTEKVKKVLGAMGYAIHIKRVPWKRCYEMVRKGKIDMAYSLLHHPTRAEYMHYPEEPLKMLNTLLVVKKKNKLASWDQTYKSIPEPAGAPLGYLVTRLMKSHGVKVDESAVDDETSFDKLWHDRVKCIMIEENVFSDILKRRGISKDEFITYNANFIGDHRCYLTISKKFKDYKKMGQEISKVLKNMKS